MDLLEHIKESRGESGQGSKAGRSAFVSGDRMPKSGAGDRAKSEKSRVKIYRSIMDALRKGFFGQMFSTLGSDRLYVITKQKWGKDKEQMVGNKVAKGFTPGTIPSKFPDVKSYAVRTLLKHGKAHSKKNEGPRFFKSRK